VRRGRPRERRATPGHVELERPAARAVAVEVVVEVDASAVVAGSLCPRPDVTPRLEIERTSREVALVEVVVQRAAPTT